MTKQSRNQKLDILLCILTLSIVASPSYAQKARTKALQTSKLSPKRPGAAGSLNKASRQILIDTTSILRIEKFNESNAVLGADETSSKSLAHSPLLKQQAPDYSQMMNTSSTAIATNTNPPTGGFSQTPSETQTLHLQNTKILPDEKEQKNWSLGFAATHFMPQREDRKPLTLSTLNLDYTLSKNSNSSWKTGAEVTYAHVWSKYEDPGVSQVDGIELNLSRSQKLGQIGLNTGVFALLPANEFDNKAGFNGALGINLGASYKLGISRMGVQAKPTFFSYRYDTSDAEGFEYNKRGSLDLDLILGFELSEKWSFNNLARVTENWNTLGTQTQTYLISSGLCFQATEILGLKAGFVSRDRVITTNEAFSENVNTVRVGLDIGI